WIGVFAIYLYLEFFQKNIFQQEIDGLEMKLQSARKTLERNLNRLDEMEKFNRSLQQEVSRITQFFEMSEGFTKVMYIDQLLPVLTSVVKKGFDIESLRLIILEDGKADLVFIQPQTNIVDFKKDINSPFIDGEKILKEEEAGFYDGETLEPLFLKLGYKTQKYRTYVIPLISEGRVSSFVMFEDLREEKTDFAHTLAGFLSLTLRKIKLYQQIQELAITDELTQVFVRRHFLRVFHNEFARVKKKKGQACFLMLDLDRFKNCNDTFGHLVGDVILRDIAGIIKQNVREVDIVGRYGGEEFCVFLPDASPENGIYVAERIRRAVEKNVFHAYDEMVRMTVSIGVSAFPYDGDEPTDLIEKADLALYYAKRKGRNRVVSYSSIK
ncbi:MAG TPA: GGDEF domain-containing protein, partial [Candidatus Omnitrophica bacterium]|nr:GGDEF domain-containing protein [Candidatus Omnitrophota bacterium]